MKPRPARSNAPAKNLPPWVVTLVARRPELVVCAADIVATFDVLAACFRGGGRVYLCGNGGSAADCEHWAGELLKGFQLRRSPRGGLKGGLRKLQDGLPAIPLTGFISLRTAVANDIAPELEFAQLVWALGRPGDVLVAISTSGDAQNVALAAQAAHSRDMRVVGLSGPDGGRLRRLARPCIHAPGARTDLIQELHLCIYHALCIALEVEFFAQRSPPRKGTRPR